MPFINSKVSIKLREDQKVDLKAKLEQAIKCTPKEDQICPVVEIKDGCTHHLLHQNEPSAMLEVKIFDDATAGEFANMTETLSGIFEKELGIPRNHIFVTFQEMEDCGWDGGIS